MECSSSVTMWQPCEETGGSVSYKGNFSDQDLEVNKVGIPQRFPGFKNKANNDFHFPKHEFLLLKILVYFRCLKCNGILYSNFLKLVLWIWQITYKPHVYESIERTYNLIMNCWEKKSRPLWLNIGEMHTFSSVCSKNFNKILVKQNCHLDSQCKTGRCGKVGRGEGLNCSEAEKKKEAQTGQSQHVQ